MRPSISLAAFHERRRHQLRMDHVTKIYARGARALDDVSLSLTPGLNCVIGAVGAGKSTLLNILSGRDRPDRGTVSFGAVDSGASPTLLRTITAYVPIDTPVPPPVPVSVAIEHFAALREPAVRPPRRVNVEAQLRQLDLWHARTLRVGELTPAMHWRLMLAIALLGSPKVLVIDEPAGALEDADLDAVMDLLETLAEERIVVFTTSNAHVIRDRCTHIVFMSRGRIVREGAADRVIDDFRGRVWTADVSREAAPHLTDSHLVLSTRYSDDMVTVVVFAHEQPGSSFAPVEPDLTHVYLYDMIASS